MADDLDLNEDFVDIIRAFREAQVEFLIVGAHALAVHGVVRATGDLDVLVRPTEQNSARVIEALKAFGAPLSTHGVTASDFARPGTVYQLGLPPYRVDILTRISGVAFEQAAASSLLVTSKALEFRVPARDVLIANKRASGRPKDLDDVARLEAAGRENDSS